MPSKKTFQNPPLDPSHSLLSHSLCTIVLTAPAFDEEHHLLSIYYAEDLNSHFRKASMPIFTEVETEA